MSNNKARNFIFNVAVLYDGEDCLLWPHATNTHGYGRIRVLGSRDKWEYAHRVICREVYGEPPTPEHTHVAHSCGNGNIGCVNPKHLRWATPTENQSDRRRHGTDNRGERNGSSRLTEDQVVKILAQKGRRQHSVIAREFSVSISTINMIMAGYNWKHLSGGDFNG